MLGQDDKDSLTFTDLIIALTAGSFLTSCFHFQGQRSSLQSSSHDVSDTRAGYGKRRRSLQPFSALISNILSHALMPKCA